MKMRIATALVAAVLFGVACGDDDDESVADDAQALCEDMASLQSTVDEVAGAQVDPNSTTVGDVQDALQSLQGQVEDVQSAESTLSTEVRSSLQSAWSDFTSAVQDIPSDDTLAEAGASVQAAQTAFQQAWATTLSQLSCESTSSTT